VADAYEQSGRTRQKRRTRNALKAAATELVAAGRQPTVAEVADAAGISKSTAYRYYPSQELMYAEVVFGATVGSGRTAIYAAAQGGEEAYERLDRVIQADHEFTTHHERDLRAALRAFLLLIESYPDAPLEPSHRVQYLTLALAPVADRIPEPTMRRLIAALSLCVGVEAAMITQVNNQLTAQESEDVKRWAAESLLRAALAEDVGQTG